MWTMVLVWYGAETALPSLEALGFSIEAQHTAEQRPTSEVRVATYIRRENAWASDDRPCDVFGCDCAIGRAGVPGLPWGGDGGTGTRARIHLDARPSQGE